MSDFLNNLLARTFVAESVLQPRMQSLFEPPPIPTEVMIPPTWGEVAEEQQALIPARARIEAQLPSDHTMTVAVPQKSLLSDPVPRRENIATTESENFARLPMREKHLDGEKFSATSQEKFRTVESVEKKVAESKKELLLPVRQPSLMPLLDEHSREPHSFLETVVIEREVNRASQRENAFAPVTARAVALPATPALPATTSVAFSVPVLPAIPSPRREEWSPITNLASEISAPTINVTIGRIEVKAALSSGKENRQPAATRQSMSLDEYLRTRNGGRR